HLQPLLRRVSVLALLPRVGVCTLHPLSPLTHLTSSFPHVAPTPHLHSLSLHDALPILFQSGQQGPTYRSNFFEDPRFSVFKKITDRKSTRLNSSHVKISYAVFCLKKKK